MQRFYKAALEQDIRDKRFPLLNPEQWKTPLGRLDNTFRLHTYSRQKYRKKRLRSQQSASTPDFSSGQTVPLANLDPMQTEALPADSVSLGQTERYLQIPTPLPQPLFVHPNQLDQFNGAGQLSGVGQGWTLDGGE